MSLSPLLIENAVRAALMEDLGHGRDVTADSIIAEDVTGAAVLRARRDGRLAGLVPALSAFTFLDPDFHIEVFTRDGEDIEAGEDIAKIQGPARTLMTAERTCLNFLTHMSGIATLTRTYVQAVADTETKICCTRKTTPGLRAFEKYAVKMGGGINHRYGLDDAILIKDNHIALAGGVEKALERAQANCDPTLKIEIEVDSLEQLQEVLNYGGADIVMLDNFTPENLQKAVRMIAGRLIIEASGGVTLDTVTEIAEAGVDFISIGALTHSAPGLDIGLDIDV